MHPISPIVTRTLQKKGGGERLRCRLFLFVFLLHQWGFSLAAAGQESSELEHFERRIRPVLVENCYKCHNSVDAAEGGLALDSREGLRRGGSSGAAVVPGNAERSLLVAALRHERDDLRMPQDGPKLSPAVIADFVTWIKRGAADPRDAPPSAEELRRATAWETVLERRKEWWSFQPLTAPQPPAVPGEVWSEHPVDRFLYAKLDAAGVDPSADGDASTLLRRLTFVLTGLPPAVHEIDRFHTVDSAGEFSDVVDELLGSPRFGERWARHWMDWFRYAESSGSEGDPSIPYVWRYRDYLIRALNADVGYDRLIREHIAGDLLPDPRIDQERGINESALATAHYRMVQHGFSPVDPLDEQVRFTENQVDVLSKAILGLTVSCARCHDHKFDAISQKDFYAFYGIMASCRPAVITVDTDARRRMHREALEALKARLRDELASVWLSATDGIAAALVRAPEPAPAAEREARAKRERERRREGKKPLPLDVEERWQLAVDEAAASDGRSPLFAWTTGRHLAGEALAKALVDQRRQWEERTAIQSGRLRDGGWDLRTGDYRRWFRHGVGLGDAAEQPGAFHVLAEGERVVANIYPSGVYNHMVSAKHNGVLTSPTFTIEADELWVRVCGGEGARVRYVVQNYPRAIGIVFKSKRLSSEDPQWIRWDMRYWKGEAAHIEIATVGDLPVEARSNPRSWFGISDIVFRQGTPPIDEPGAPLASVVSPSEVASTAAALAELYTMSLTRAIEAWRRGDITDAQASFLGFFVRHGLLPNRLDELANVAPLVAEYRRLEQEIPIPTRAPGVTESVGFDQPLFVRGNHKQPAAPVPRRFLEAFGGKPYETALSGRRELAEDLIYGSPLAPRVIVNRVWHHVFGRGLVATCDNFGRLGEEPSHPELLDYLAVRFVEDGWSIKKLVRLLVTSRAFRLSARSSEAAVRLDPENRLLSHASVRRLEAEAIRDAVLAVSGELDTTMFGASQPGTSRRRSVYVEVRRNSLDPFLHAFDAPSPFSTQGRRAATNVPAQSLMLLNDPFVSEQAKAWAEKVLGNPALADTEARLRHMFVSALGRAPEADEVRELVRYVVDIDRADGAGDHEAAIWSDVAHGFFNFKEFIYLR